ncbi:hypothetical protein N7492_005921 [Penicillium capsulatum]|uniref:Nuclear membrane fusion protein Kar5 n=1 Tax=Penicillium capsulatum TaxID=69766 RepID=A0A9W9ICX9_9EURO|nr:hypothetical protein N7492_005921 [Penicillium capsulatum]KAJ6134976.1 hypothetical protein N7512_000136 [Penicillium capsulatum]
MKYFIASQLVLAMTYPYLTSASTEDSGLGSATGPFHIYAENREESNAISYLENQTRHQDTIFHEAVQLLDSMKSSPSCNRIAATKLVTSCQSVGGKGSANPDTHETLDRIRSIYAARLAFCELDGTGATAPSSCLPLTAPSPTQKVHLGFSFKAKTPETDPESIPKDILEQCLRVLESRPQWWTSYSNNRQNAIVICQAARIETEREELLDLHRSIVERSAKLNDGLRQAAESAAMDSTRNQVFAQSVQALQEKILTDIEGGESLIRRKFDAFLHDMELGVGNIITSITSALKHVKQDSGTLQKDIRNASAQTKLLQQALQATYDDIKLRDNQALQTHQQNALLHRELSSAMHLSLESLIDTDLARMSQNMARFDASLEWLTSRLTGILEKETEMAQRLHAMGEAMKSSEQKAMELQKAQSLQTEVMAAQARAQEAMQYNTKISQTLLDKTAITAANLQTMMDETAIKMKRVPGLHLGGFSAYSVCVILLIVIGAQNLRVAISLLFLIIGHSVATSFYQYL